MRLEKKELIVVRGRVVGLLLRFKVIIRIYMRGEAPQRFGIRIMRELPDLLSDEEVRSALEIPEFDDVIVREHSLMPMEADITLMKDGNVVKRYSVKATPRGNIAYVISSWRMERGDLDLMAIIPLEGRKNGEIVYYVAVILVPAFMKGRRFSEIRKCILDAIKTKMEDEGLEGLWITDFAEIASAIRDFTIIKNQNEMLRLQREFLVLQREYLRIQSKMLGLLEKIVEALREMQAILKEEED